MIAAHRARWISRRLKRRLAEVVAIDFFGAPGREAAEGLVSGVEARMNEKRSGKQASKAPTTRREDLQGKTWVTRKGIHVDRMVSAWFIRRFIDSSARFKFVPPKGYKPLPANYALTCSRRSLRMRATVAPWRF